MELAGAQEWRTGLQKHFSRASRRRWHKLYGDVVCILSGLKPALLVDYIPPNSRALQRFLGEVLVMTSSSSTVTSCAPAPPVPNLCIVELDQDVLLVNTDTLQQWKEGVTFPASSSESFQMQFVDVTPGRGQPSLIGREERETLERELAAWHSRLTAQLATLLFVEEKQDKVASCTPTQKEDLQHRISLVRISSDGVPLNLCSLFGWLLGYPVVYWFGGSGDHSLHAEELVCHTVEVWSEQGTTTNKHPYSLDTPHTAYSFTVPLCVSARPSVQTAIEHWFARLSRAALGANMSAKISQNTVFHPTVAL